MYWEDAMGNAALWIVLGALGLAVILYILVANTGLLIPID